MDLYFLRHAPAVDRGTADYPDDSRRPLSPKGQKTMNAVARGMATLGLSFDMILSSPFVRARQTADIVAQEFNSHGSVVLTKNLVPDASIQSLVHELAGYQTKTPCILLVGHEPLLSQTISYLLTKTTGLPFTLKKAGLCYVSAPVLSKRQSATLQWILTPSQLKQIGK